MDFANRKTFFVLGLAKSGKAVARLLAIKGFDVAVFDDNPKTRDVIFEAPEMDEVRDRIDVVDDNDAPARAIGSDCLVLSPGVPLDHPLVRRARERGVEITGELEIAYHFCDADIVGVTGTNGKSTVVSMLGDMFKAAGRPCIVAGNIGTPLSAVVDETERVDVVVLEISSFQLDTILDFKAHVAVLLNVTADHLDRYESSFEKYVASKSRILNGADADTWFVYNDGDEVCRSIAGGFDGHKIPFGSDRPGHDAVFVRDETIVRSWRGTLEPVLALREFSPVGIHNLENALAAVAAVGPFDVGADAAGNALRRYRPLAHRMELIRVAGGVAYINDSKATNVDATVKSVESIDGSVVLIMGGLDKGGDFTRLKRHMTKVKHAILIGEAADKIAAAIGGNVVVSRAASMDEAIRIAVDVSASGDTVLLAPGCASFDMFKDYADRGVAFKTAVNSL